MRADSVAYEMGDAEYEFVYGFVGFAFWIFILGALGTCVDEEEGGDLGGGEGAGTV